MKSSALAFFSQHRIAVIVVALVLVAVAAKCIHVIVSAISQKRLAAEARRLRAERDREGTEKPSYFFTRR